MSQRTMSRDAWDRSAQKEEERKLRRCEVPFASVICKVDLIDFILLLFFFHSFLLKALKLT